MVAVCAVRTGCGKSQTTRKVARILRDAGLKVVAVRHPMPYGDLAEQRVQRFAELADLDRHQCTIEEREEYEPHIVERHVVYAGVDYEAILRAAEQEGGRRRCGTAATTTCRSTCPTCTSSSPTRCVPATSGATTRARPTCGRPTSSCINKVDSADPADVETVRRSVRRAEPRRGDHPRPTRR